MAELPRPTAGQSAHILAALVSIQGLAALGGLAWLIGYEGQPLTHAITLYFFVVAALSFLAGVLEWSRVRFAEMLALLAIFLSFGLTLAAVLGGFWYLVPFIGIATIAAIFGLVDRFAARDELRQGLAHQ